MIRIGRVVEIQDEFLKICFNRPEACNSCKLCGTGRDKTTVSLRGDAQVGDLVEVDMPGARVVKVSALAYLIPLVGLISGLLLGNSIFPSREAYVFLSGLVMMAVFLGGVKLIDRKLGVLPAWQPRILRIIPSAQEDGHEITVQTIENEEK